MFEMIDMNTIIENSQLTDPGKFEGLPDDTRVWIYQSTRPFDAKDVPQVKQYLQQFAQQWVSHNQQLRAYGDLLHERFVLLMVDESMAGASGCSIDKSVAFLKALQSEFGVDLFDRMYFSYWDGEQVVTASREAFASQYASGKINEDTYVFDTLVSNKGDLQNRWLKPLGESWHKRMV